MNVQDVKDSGAAPLRGLRVDSRIAVIFGGTVRHVILTTDKMEGTSDCQLEIRFSGMRLRGSSVSLFRAGKNATRGVPSCNHLLRPSAAWCFEDHCS